MTTRPRGALPSAPEPWTPSQIPAFRSRPPYAMSEMIAAEPELAERLIRRLMGDETVETLATAISETMATGRPILVTGCGTSEHGAMGVAALLNEALEATPRQEIRSAPALEAVRRPPVDGLLIAVSHEGGTQVTNQALRAAAHAGARTAVITVSGGSPAAGLAEFVVRTGEQDQSWCHTVGYLSPLIAGLVLGARLRRARLDAIAVHALLSVSTSPRMASDVASGLTGIDRLVVAGAGADWGTARELALKVAEGARLPADAIEIETLLHGSLAAATRWTGLVLVVTDPSVMAVGRDRVRRLLGAAAALSLPTAAVLSEAATVEIDAELTPAGRVVVPTTGRVRGVAASIIGAAIPIQLVAERLARARGVNPDTLGREDAAQANAHA